MLLFPFQQGLKDPNPQHEGDHVRFETPGQSRQRLEGGVSVVVGKVNSLLIVATRKEVAGCTWTRFSFDAP